MVTPLDELLTKMVDVGASDLHLKVGSPPVVRIDGELHLTKLPTLTPEDTLTYAESIFPPKASAEFKETNEANFAYGRRDFGRFRVNVFRQRGSVSVVMRRVHHKLASLRDLGLPLSLEQLRHWTSGLVVVAGPSSSGKTTTLASMIDDLNRNRSLNIVTIEDPIEVVHSDQQSIVSQREIGMDTGSYETALEHVLRQDPDVILVDRLNDAATVRACLQAAEMGHLVLSSLPTSDVVESVNRLIDLFPAEMHSAMRAQLAGQLQAVVCQRLLERSDARGRVLAVELMLSTPETRECIVDESRTAELTSVVEAAQPDMQSYDQAIAGLYEAGTISHATAVGAASDHDAMVAVIGDAPPESAQPDRAVDGADFDGAIEVESGTEVDTASESDAGAEVRAVDEPVDLDRLVPGEPLPSLAHLPPPPPAEALSGR